MSSPGGDGWSTVAAGQASDVFDARPEQWNGPMPIDKHIVGHDFGTSGYGTEAPTE